MGKIRYLRRSAVALLDPGRARCPNCGGSGAMVSRKYGVTTLRRCSDCAMLYRAPVDTPAEAETFYNVDYSQGYATDVPGLAELEVLRAEDFASIGCSYPRHIGVLRELGVPDGARVFDFGCSWGYGSYVFARAGFAVKSYEISVPRASFGRQHLGVDLAEDFDGFVAANPASFDVFFSSHVLEHVPSPSQVVAKAFALLKPGGLLVSTFPNGSDAHRRADPWGWHRLWGEAHPNLLDDVFLASLLADKAYLVGASPPSIDDEARRHLAAGKPGGLQLGDLVGYELCVVARKPG